MLYPLKFKPLFKERIWGGHKLASIYAHNSTARLGECWAMSALDGDLSQVAGGALEGVDINQLIDQYGAKLLGARVMEQHNGKLPLLIKLLHAADVLSIQVHPDNSRAAIRHNCLGKSEMWYIVDAGADAMLYLGFNRTVTAQQVLDHITQGTLPQLLNAIKVKAGDAFYVPSGLVHAIGAGVVIAEIQQSSDITYRLFDWNRVDKSGKARELHTDLAMDVIDYQGRTPEEISLRGDNHLLTSPSFTTNKVTIDGTLERSYSDLDSFVALMIVDGQLTIDGQKGRMGECFLIPACMDQITIQGHGTLLESWV